MAAERLPRRPLASLALPAAILAVAVAARLFGLGAQSIWADEGATWWNSTNGSWKDTLYSERNHPPLWWLLTRAWLGLFPGREAALRMPAAILGILAVVLVWRLALRLSRPTAPLADAAKSDAASSPAVALWVLALAAISPYWILESQEARMYSALLCESLGMTLLYLRWRDGGGRGALVAYGVVGGLALATHYYAIWTFVGHAAHAVWTPKRSRAEGRLLSLRGLFVAQAAAGAALVPWVVRVLRHWRGLAPTPFEPIPKMAEALFRIGSGPAIAPMTSERFASGQGGSLLADPVRVAVAAALWFVPIAFGVVAVVRDRSRRSLVATSLALPLVGMLLVCLRWPLINERYVVFLAPWLLWLAVVGALSAPGALRPILLAGLVLLHVLGFLAYHANGVEPVRAVVGGGVPYAKEPWRDAHAFVAERRVPDDVVLVHARFLVWSWAFYDADDLSPHRAPAFPLPTWTRGERNLLTPAEILDAVPSLERAPQVFFVLSHEATPVKGHFRAAILEALTTVWGHVRVAEERLFPGGVGVRVIRIVRD